ncbi:acylneuraminate cytidylyltransferase family protein [Solitalea koreensis]|uniref:N-acylneuraminate cytidylyltransferase n=1 Tax=Solitalea koreensis TaxID=543615 RepID=A0A521CNY7_9SPHI|nr:acylneuraminate cytidylyltransferase family protein [Solitalea koreensis]SMO61173.1 N-acylneuraminate cytidylyltransferase [Solitalea koreensis]
MKPNQQLSEEVRSETLFLIPARGGSKGIPGKNIKPLAGKPLIYYAIDVARELSTDEHICVSTDDEGIKSAVEDYNMHVPFMRPTALATDQSGTYEVLLHAINFYKEQGKNYKILVLLQPTSPFRTSQQVKEALSMFSFDLDMVVSVTESKNNPYYNLFEEDQNGFLHKSKEGAYTRRQDCPSVYAYNGAIYVINVSSLVQMPLHQFTKIKKYEMDERTSIDLDTLNDWKLAEILTDSYK